METDSWMESRTPAKDRGGGSKRDKVLMDVDNIVVIVGGGIRGLNGNGKIYNKIFLKNMKTPEEKDKTHGMHDP